MVSQGLGISAMYSLVLTGFEKGLAIRPIKECPERNVALAWKNWKTMSFASRKFMSFIRKILRRKNSVELCSTLFLTYYLKYLVVFQ